MISASPEKNVPGALIEGILAAQAHPHRVAALEQPFHFAAHVLEAHNLYDLVWVHLGSRNSRADSPFSNLIQLPITKQPFQALFYVVK
jgi:hypothetical protein